MLNIISEKKIRKSFSRTGKKEKTNLASFQEPAGWTSPFSSHASPCLPPGCLPACHALWEKNKFNYNIIQKRFMKKKWKWQRMKNSFGVQPNSIDEETCHLHHHWMTIPFRKMIPLQKTGQIQSHSSRNPHLHHSCWRWILPGHLWWKTVKPWAVKFWVKATIGWKRGSGHLSWPASTSWQAFCQTDHKTHSGRKTTYGNLHTNLEAMPENR